MAALLLLWGLGGRDLWAPDEPRYGQVAEELRSMRHGPPGLVLLHLNGEVYTQKPPLYYWLAALCGAPAGRVTETAARLPSALAGLSVLALTLWLGRRLLGARTAFFGAALLLSVARFPFYSRRVQLDVLLMLFETAALAAFWRLDRGIGRRGANLAALHASLGLAVLVKGPVGFLVPAFVIAVFLVWERRLGALARAAPPWALLLSIGPGVAWLAAASALAPPGYLDQAVGENVLGRFFAGTSHVRPFYYYTYRFPTYFLPWTLLWPAVYLALRRGVLRGDADTARSWRFLLAWVGATFVFFSLSAGKRGIYMVTTFPPAALLCADAVVRQIETRGGWSRAVDRIALAFLAIAGAVALGLSIADPFPVDLPLAFGLTTALAGAAAAAAWLRMARAGAHPLHRFAVLVGFVLVAELATVAALLPALDPEKSPRPMANAAARLTAPGERVGLVGNRGLVGGLVYYGGRPVTELDHETSIREYVEGGGRVIVVRDKDLERVEAVTDVEIRAEARSGRRKLLVVEVQPDGAGRRL